MIELDTETPVVPRSLLRSLMSTACSMVAHLILLLFLTLFLLSSKENREVTLNVGKVTDEIKDDAVMIAPLDSVAAEESLEFDTEAFKNVLDEVEVEDISDQLLAQSDIPQFAEDEQGDDSLLEPEEGFFGLKTTGDRIVYIIDSSPSMEVGNPSRFERAVEEVKWSVSQLRPDQKFFVFLFSWKTQAMNLKGEFKFAPASEKYQKELGYWLDSITDLPDGTDPREAIVMALRMKPTCCFLLSDGEFNGHVGSVNNPPFGGGRKAKRAAELARMYNRNHCPIHTIGLEDKANQKVLAKIARESKGQYKFIPAIN